MNTLNNFISPFVERAISMSKSASNEDDEGKDFTHSLSRFTQDRKVLRDQLVSTLLAGRDTTACALSWLFYELAYHPDVFSRLREEILSTVGKHGQPTYEDLKGMKYLQWCLNESTFPLYHSKVSSPFIPHCSLQRQDIISRHHSPHWRRSQRQRGTSPTYKPTNLSAHCRPSRHPRFLLRNVHATTRRPFRTHCQRLQSLPMGNLDSRPLDLYPLQRWPTNLSWTKLCVDRDGVCDCQIVAAVWCN